MVNVGVRLRIRSAMRLSTVIGLALTPWVVSSALAVDPASFGLAASQGNDDGTRVSGVAVDAEANSISADDAVIEGASGLEDGAEAEDGIFARTAAEVIDTGPAAAADVPGPGSWQENATRLYHDSVIHLAWRNEMGDRGPTVLGQVEITDTNTTKTVRMPVSGGNNFYITTDGGWGYIVSREGASWQRPTLIVNGSTRYTATRDTHLNASTVSARGSDALMKDSDVMLIAFDGYQPQANDRVELELTTTAQYGARTLKAYAPNIQYVYPTIPSRSDSTVVANFTGASFKPKPNITVQGDIATATLEGTALTAFSQLFKLPIGEEYYLTSLVKLHADWPNKGGKLPGLTNTGQATNTAPRPLTVDGHNCNNSGWGGRPANGCRWSARTGWSGRNGDKVGLSTYFYAHAPKNGSYGVMQFWPTPIEVGKWFAYVQRVKLNTPGEGNGQLSYWLCSSAGCLPQFHRADIAWRAWDMNESRISEIWANIFCGGSNCGTAPWPRSTASIKRLTVTKGLPDLNALAGEVRAINGDADDDGGGDDDQDDDDDGGVGGVD